MKEPRDNSKADLRRQVIRLARQLARMKHDSAALDTLPAGPDRWRKLQKLKRQIAEFEMRAKPIEDQLGITLEDT